MEARSVGPNSYLQHHLGHFSWRVADEDSDAVGVAGGTVRALKVFAVHALLERLLLRQNDWDLAHRLVQVVLHQHLQGGGSVRQSVVRPPRADRLIGNTLHTWML